MPVVRMKRTKNRDGEQKKVLGAIGLLGLVGCAVAFQAHAAAFASMSAAPLAGASHAVPTVQFAAPSQTDAQLSAPNHTLAACAVIAVVVAARSALAGSMAGHRKAPRAVVRCATSPSAPAPAVHQAAAACVTAPPTTPLIELDAPQAMASPLVAEVFSAASPSIACHLPMPTVVSAAAAPVEDIPATFAAAAATTARAAFAGAAARVIGGARYSSSRKRSQSRSNKSIRCYVAQKFTEVVPLEPAYDPSRLSAKMQAGVQVTSRMRHLSSREAKNSPASMSAGLFSGVNDLIYRTIIRQQSFKVLA
eukprot:TRINITY_DN2306_c0_g2_i1.p1 TRINITY_DN2306_c0_g2~~TRINITY_DN2306_c0_g2_i1.p1  ORF type:complete len:307 (+),score=46.88 TRINITY_DN2306_c0_g2_i1:71-991(+)